MKHIQGQYDSQFSFEISFTTPYIKKQLTIMQWCRCNTVVTLVEFTTLLFFIAPLCTTDVFNLYQNVLPYNVASIVFRAVLRQRWALDKA
jgi:hypothetical protein